MSDMSKLQQLCAFISNNLNGCLEQLKELRVLVKDAQPHSLQRLRPIIIGILCNYIQKPNKYKNEIKAETINILTEVFNKLKTDNIGFYFNISAFLLNEIYDPKEKNFVKNIYEEYKLLVVNCLIALNNSVSISIILDIYDKEHTPKYSPIIYVCIGLAKSEKLRLLRIAAMECIMTIARIDTDSYTSDTVLCSQIADIFMFFLPGVSSGLSKVYMEDEKVGHRVIKTAVRCWGRMINLLMKDYNPQDKKITFDINSLLVKTNIKTVSPKASKWKNDSEINEYIKKSSRTVEWYREADSKLYQMVNLLQNVCNHTHSVVRLELADICLLLLANCAHTMPKCLSKIIEIIITLSEDEEENISNKCRIGLEDLSSKLSKNYFKHLLDNLEEDFYGLLNSIPRIFNGLDSQKQTSCLNLLIGYLGLFGKYELVTVLHSTAYLSKLIESLLYICELERSNAQLLEEWRIQDFEMSPDLRTPWKRFRHFTNDNLSLKLTQLCELLAQDIIMDIVVDCLLDTYINDPERRKGATILLNEILSAKTENININTIKTVIDMYLSPSYWNIPIVPFTSEGSSVNLTHIQNNIIQLCLQLEGIGKMALLLQSGFQDFLLKALYPVIEKAGCGQPLLKAAGLTTIKNISVACKYNSVTDLINQNSDYFSYHVTRKLRQLNKNEHVLNVLGVVMSHCSMDVLPSIADIVEDVLYQSRDCTNKNIASFMRVFNIFIKCLLRWLDVKVTIQPIKSRADKLKELQDFQISNLEEECNDFSDGIMGKTAEEMYEEDMKKNKEEVDEDDYAEVEELKKPEPPQHIKLTVAILKRTLHFMPSKNKDAKILSLVILKNGLEVIRDWEDELLPIVHQIWSPLVNRFKDDNDHLIFNLSFQLLVSLARLSKDFIRSRTIKDVLPAIHDNLEKLSKESYLKDRGSSYRYTQAYKLQMNLLENFAGLLIDLEMSPEQMQTCMKVAQIYLSNKQPLPLRNNCAEFHKTLALYDCDMVRTNLDSLDKTSENEKTIRVIMNCLNK